MILKLGSITVAPVVTVQPSGYSLQTKSVTPTLSLQTVSADAGYYGLQIVTVSAVTSSIDSNIQASYIKSGISILGVTGTLSGGGSTPTQSKTANPSTTTVTVTPDAGYALSLVTINAVTSSIDNNITAGNIKSGVTILGVAGTYQGTVINNQNKTVNPSTAQQSISADAGYTGLGTVTVNAMTLGAVTVPTTATSTGATLTAGTNTLTLSKTISLTPNVTTAGYISQGTAGNITVSLTATVSTQAAKTITPTTATQTALNAGYYTTGAITVASVTSAIDANIVAGNIKSGTTILGVTGTYEGAIPTASTLTIFPSITTETYTPTAGTYYNQVVASPVTSSIDSNIQASNIMSGVTILGVAGNVVFQTYYSGSSAPSSSLGVEGDIYLQV